MTSVSYEASAGQTEFQITFDYISEAHLRVLVNQVETNLFTVTPENLLVLDSSFVILEGMPVEIRRDTPSEELLANFAPASSIRATEIRTGFRQILFVLQEVLQSTLSGLRKTINGQRWEGESLPLGNLGEPLDSSDAATKSYVDSLAGQAGVLPAPTVADIGKGIRIRGGGSLTYDIGAINGATLTTRIPMTGINNGAASVAKTGSGTGGIWLTSDDTRMPLEVETTVSNPEFGSFGVDPNGYDMLLPRGSFKIEAEGPVRSLTATANTNFTNASAAITTGTGEVLDIRASIVLGRGGGSQNHPIEPGPSFQAQSYVRLQATVTLFTATRINLRISGSTFGDEVVADTPWRLTATEVIR